MNGCCPQHLHIGTARMKNDIEKGKQKKEHIEKLLWAQNKKSLKELSIDQS